MKNKLNILTDWWWEILIYQFQKFLPKGINIERLNKGILGKKSFDGWDFKNALLMRNYESHNDFPILHYNNWLDPVLCKLPKDKVTIFESHTIQLGFSLYNSVYILDWFIKRVLAFFVHFIYKVLFIIYIKKIDVYFVSIPSIMQYASKVRKDVVWLPNAIDFSVFEKNQKTIDLDKNYINIFLPTSVRKIKNQQKAWEVIDNISKKYNNLRIYIINHNTSNYSLIDNYIKKYKDCITWLPLVNREDIGWYYKTDWDLMFWSLWYNDDYAMLNLIELEAMVCKAPVVVMDSFEIIKVKYKDIEQLAWNLLEDKDFKKKYIKRNFNYVKDVHSLESVSKIYIDTLRPVIKRKLGVTI